MQSPPPMAIAIQTSKQQQIPMGYAAPQHQHTAQHQPSGYAVPQHGPHHQQQVQQYQPVAQQEPLQTVKTDSVIDATGEVNAYQQQLIERELAVKKDLVNGRIIWKNEWMEDAWIYQKNNHPFLSIFTAHRLHPFSRNERIFVYLFGLVMAFFVTSMSLQFAHCKDEELVQRIYCPIAPGLPGGQVGTCLPVVAQVGCFECLETRGECYDDAKKKNWAGNFAWGLVVTAYVYLLRKFATCGCVQGEKYAIDHPTLKKAVEFIGHVFMGLCGILSIILIVEGTRVIKDSEVNAGIFLWNWAITQATATVYAVLMGVAMYEFWRRREYARLTKEYQEANPQETKPVIRVETRYDEMNLAHARSV